jgi:hypothetical protein
LIIQNDILLSNAQYFVGLETQAPSWMYKTVFNRSLGVFFYAGAVLGLEQEVLKMEVLKGFWRSSFLRINQFQFIAGLNNDLCVRLGTHRYPVYVFRKGQRPVCFDGNFKTTPMERPYEVIVNLERWFTAGEYHQRARFW